MLFFFFSILNVALILLMLKIAPLIGLVDHPDHRKKHYGHIPLIGGLGIYLSLLITIFFFDIGMDYIISFIFFVSFIIMITGVIDDIFKIRVIYRIIIQSFAVLLIINSGLSIDSLGNYLDFTFDLSQYNLSIFFTIFCILALVNSINFIDGIDGLASSLIIVSLITVCAYIYFTKINLNLMYIYLLINSLFIFLFFNLFLKSPFKIFLGDSGSTFLGFFLGFFLIYLTRYHATFHPILAAWTIAYPVFDSSSVILLRLKNKKNPFLPDRRHFHHILIDSGYSNLKSFFIIILSSILLSILGGVSYFAINSFVSLLFFIVLFFSYIGLFINYDNKKLK